MKLSGWHPGVVNLTPALVACVAHPSAGLVGPWFGSGDLRDVACFADSALD